MGKLPATLNITTNPTGYMAAASTVYAAAVMIYNAYHHHGVIDVPVIIAAATAIAALLTRQIVTPVAAPRDGAGTPLVPVTQAAAVLAPAVPGPPAAGVRVVPPGVIGVPVAQEPPGGTP
jgi:hypothetical protein